MHTIDVLVLGTAVVFIVLMAAVLGRQRYMLRVGGAVPLAIRLHGARWGYGIARFLGDELRWYRALGVGTRPSRVMRRADLVILSRRDPVPEELSALPATAVVVQCRHRDQTCTMAFSEDAFTGFTSWLEASAPKF
ncbi:MAG TPA: DUF2550 domain-containing protein [Jatrophihabitantaceae bacterium]|nr:DUF2550 domain-containing protein [Jatrophihabitantaceae bacterium]